MNHRTADPFDRWLEAATAGLCASAVARIRDEMRPHYEDAVDHLEPEGLARDEAEKIALQQLGDARKARRGFKRSNLTAVEHRKLAGLAKLPGLPFRLSGWSYAVLASPFLISLVLVAIVGAFSDDFQAFYIATFILAGLFSIPLILYTGLMPIALPIRYGRPRLGIAISVFFWTLCLSASIPMVLLKARGVSSGVLVPIYSLFLMLRMLVCDLILLRKLARIPTTELTKRPF
ncbi:MAG: permease prefix domain 1-containing protein [Candidatus Hydrogenedentales bacterium]|jgi:hypothetical protein